MRKGYIKLSSKYMDINAAVELLSKYSDFEGFIAYNTTVLPINNFKKEYLEKKNEIITEIDIWKETENGYVEISIELDNGEYLVQTWELFKTEMAQDDTYLCYYKDAKVFSNNKSVIPNLAAVEVVIPQFRYHIYLSRKAG